MNEIALRVIVSCIVLFFSSTLSQTSVQAKSRMLKPDYARLVARANLRYGNPVEQSEAGMPIGNGRMGTLLWTTPTALKMQINRVDIFANGSATGNFPQRHTDYCGGAGFVDVEFIEYGDAVFTDEQTQQHLSCYDGLARVEGKDIQIQALAWHEQDVIALHVTDQREQSGTVSVNLRMLRNPDRRTAGHIARSTLDSRDGAIILTQRFEEKGYYCGSAVAVGVYGRHSEIRQADERRWQLTVQPGRGSFTVLIASAAGFNREENLTSAALTQLNHAADREFLQLAASNKAWWHDFWSRSFVHLSSEDGTAEMIEAHYTYYLYLMACTSRGTFPAKFNGMLWTTGGDTRQWGGQYWGANQSCLYNSALLAANHPELLAPHFDMYSSMLESCALAARQQWGSQGIFIPETLSFDGLSPLPEEIAEEMRELYLLRKPWQQKSEPFLAYARHRLPHASRWNWKANGHWQDGYWTYPEKGGGPFGHVTHIFSRGAKIAYQYWLRYEYTQDEKWLADRAYPVLKGVAEFYRHYPNLRKEADGKYHIHHINSNESIWGGRNTDEEIASMMGILPVVIRASEILDRDADRRPLWQELLDHLSPLPTSDHPDVRASGRPPDEAPYWIRALPPIAQGGGTGRPDGNTMPMWFFDLCTLENDDSETMKIARATYDGYARRGINKDTRIGVLSKVAVTAAMMGRADHIRHLLPNQLSYPDRAPAMANRMDQREGRQTTSAQRLGRAADTLHNALVQSVPPTPGKPPVIRVFPAWPDEWDAHYTLLCRSGFLVSSAMQDGRVDFVEIQSQYGGECRLRNPWYEQDVILFRNGSRSETLSTDLLKFDTARNESIVIVRAETTPEQFKRTVPTSR